MIYDSRADIRTKGFEQFMGLTLKMADNVIIPRAETELLGRTALQELAGVRAPLAVDMCCGSGNLACALALNIGAATVWAADSSLECVSLTSTNAALLGLEDRVTAVQSDLFTSLYPLVNSADLVVCNPPYIPSRTLDTQRRSLLEQEPRKAFDGGPYGLDILRRLVRDALGVLRDDGVLCFEFGQSQHVLASRLLENSRAYHSIRLVNDSAGVPRVAVARKKVCQPALPPLAE